MQPSSGNWLTHYNDVIISAMASQITSLKIAYSTVYSGTDQRKHQSSTSLAFMRGIHRSGPVTRKMFPFDGVIMLTKDVRIDVWIPVDVEGMGMVRCNQYQGVRLLGQVYCSLHGIWQGDGVHQGPQHEVVMVTVVDTTPWNVVASWHGNVFALRVLCDKNLTATVGFPSQGASNAL